MNTTNFISKIKKLHPFSQNRQIPPKNAAHFLSNHYITLYLPRQRIFLLQNTFKLLLLKWEKTGSSRERDRETLTWQRAVGNRAASLSALIRGRRGHKGMPCRETPMSRRWEAVKGCSKLFLPTGLFPL